MLKSEPFGHSVTLFFVHWQAATPGSAIPAHLPDQAAGTNHFDLARRKTMGHGVGRAPRLVRYGYTTPDFSGFTAMVEGETLYAWSDSDQLHFLDEAVQGTELNQFWAQYAEADYGSLKLGRQIYTLDDHRFIGHVGWRQNIQTFDAATIAFTGIENLTVNGFYLDAVNRVNGDDVAMNGYGLNTK
ncbi:MAG: alginate export family protein [Opitutales bacterium]